MIIKQGEFVSFTPAELQVQPLKPAPVRSRKRAVLSKRVEPKREAPVTRGDLLQEVERLVRANERLTLERDHLREEFSRQSLEVRRAKITRKKPAHVDENMRHQTLAPSPPARQDVEAESTDDGEADDPGFELARVVVNWFWEDADDASVRLVHDALTGQGIRTLVRDADTEAE